MTVKSNLSNICVYRLTETYHILFEKQEKLGISDEYLLSTVRGTQEDVEQRTNLIQLQELLKQARDNLITWYLKQTLVELNVTISLVTAKIKFIEYKLGLCDGLDLHQACSLSLVDFCNILTDLIKVQSSPEKKKNMHIISEETGLPVWLSHYRNLICHVPSEGPCISILVPLVQKSLDYMKESFWLRVIERESFNEHKFKKIVNYICKLTQLKCKGRQLVMKKDVTLGKRKQRDNETSMKKHAKVCLMFRRQLSHNQDIAINILTSHMVSKRYDDKSRNNSLMITQIIYARSFEKFVMKLVSLSEQNPEDKTISSWLSMVICLLSCPNNEELSEKLEQIGIKNKELAEHIDIAPVKCCRIAYRLMMLEGPEPKRLLIRMRHKLLPVLGKQRTALLTKMTRISGFEKML